MAAFTCKVDEVYRSACVDLPEYQHTGYCVLHYPSELYYPSDDKKGVFEEVVKSKLAHKEYDFSGTVFPKENSQFERVVFEEPATFSGATFYGDALFDGVTFKDVSFSAATFCNRAVFFFSTFRGNVDFSSATFSGWTSFPITTFNGRVNFMVATIQDNIRFSGSNDSKVFSPEAELILNGLQMEKSERVEFETVLLRPSWFVGVDARKFNFTNVTWYGLLEDSKGQLDKEVEALRNRGDVRAPYFNQLSKACMSLSVNAEENREYPLANEFSYWSMDALRKEGWSHLRGLTVKSLTKKETWHAIGEHFSPITTLYWALSGYGVRAVRAFFVLVAICAAFGVLYMLLGPDALRVSSASNFGQAMAHLGQAVVYSLSTMARLNPEPKPDPGLFQFLVAIEGILGPLQIALFALALRRQVMR